MAFSAAVHEAVKKMPALRAGDNPAEAFPANEKFRVMANARIGSLVQMDNAWVNCGWFGAPGNAAFHGAIEQVDNLEDHLRYAPLPRQVVVSMLSSEFFEYGQWTLANGGNDLVNSERFKQAWARAVNYAYGSTPAKPSRFKQLTLAPAQDPAAPAPAQTARFRWNIQRTQLLPPQVARLPACTSEKNQRRHILELLKQLHTVAVEDEDLDEDTKNPFFSENARVQLEKDNVDHMDVAFIELSDRMTNPDVQREVTYNRVDADTEEYVIRFTRAHVEEEAVVPVVEEAVVPVARRYPLRDRVQRILAGGQEPELLKEDSGDSVFGWRMPTETGVVLAPEQELDKLVRDACAVFRAQLPQLPVTLQENISGTNTLQCALHAAALMRGVVLVDWNWVSTHVMEASAINYNKNWDVFAKAEPALSDLGKSKRRRWAAVDVSQIAADGTAPESAIMCVCAIAVTSGAALRECRAGPWAAPWISVHTAAERRSAHRGSNALNIELLCKRDDGCEAGKNVGQLLLLMALLNSRGAACALTLIQATNLRVAELLHSVFKYQRAFNIPQGEQSAVFDVCEPPPFEDAHAGYLLARPYPTAQDLRSIFGIISSTQRAS